MTLQREYVCWKNDAVLAITPRDAASLGQGHFQAIHHPLRLRRRKLDQRVGGAWVEEGAIVTALRGELSADGYLFLPIVGGSGTGKSHLVRWARDRSIDTPNWECRYLPKNRTGLRQALNIIMQGLDGSAVNTAREALATASSAAEKDDILGERLLDDLALVISRHDEFLDVPAGEDDRARQTRQKLVRELPDVLRDPVVRRRLLAPEAVILRLVGLSMRGRQEGDGLDDDATNFRASDLPLTFHELSQASAGARKLLAQLAAIGSLLDAALELINRALPLAEKRITVSSQVSLVEIFRELRRTLHAQSKELVLFIEDLTVLHGVEKEFLDAIVEPVQGPEGRMCNLRLLFAVTEGHFDSLDTVRTRCEDAYWFDSEYGEDGVTTEDAVAFLGRYLNAARLAPAKIDEAWKDRVDDEGWVVNACTPCDYRVDCHDTFKTSPQGYGLYPYNPEAIERLVIAAAPRGFDPREVVRQLVRRFLQHGAADMKHSDFPSADLLEVFATGTEPLPALLSSEVQARRPTDHVRFANVLRYWSDTNTPGVIDSRVLEAFALDNAEGDLKALRAVVGGGGPTKRPVKKIDDASREPLASEAQDLLRDPARRRQFDELVAWAGNGRDLTAATTQALRKLIHKAVLTNLEFGAVPVNLGDAFEEGRFSLAQVVLEGSVTQQRPGAATIIVQRTVSSATALQGLLLLTELGESGFPQADRYRRLAADAVDEWTAAVSATLTRPAGERVISAVHALLVASVVLGRTDLASTPRDYMRAIFSNSDATAPATDRSPVWKALHARATHLVSKYAPVVNAEFGEARGVRGETRAIQAHRLLPLIETFVASWTLQAADPQVSSFFRAVEQAVDDEFKRLQQELEPARTLIDRTRAWDEQVDKVLSVVQVAHQAGRLKSAGELEALRALSASANKHGSRDYFRLLVSLDAGPAMPQFLAVLASDLPSTASSAAVFAVRGERAITGIEDSLKSRQASEGMRDIEAVTNTVLDSAQGLLDVVKALS